MVPKSIRQRILALQALGAKEFSLPYKSIPGVISAKALEEHLKVFQGYKDTLKRIDDNFETMGKDEVPKKHMPEHPFRAIKLAETYALGGVILHELYFNNLTNKPSDVNGLEVEKFIKEHFDSMAEWRHCMRGSLMESRGWVVFGVDNTGEYRILMMDAHDCGASFDCKPLVVIDVYEHSYWMDHGADRAAYVDGILKCLNWEEINRRFTTR